MLLFISFHLCRFHSVISVSMNWNFKSRLKNLENSLTFTIPHFTIKMITLISSFQHGKRILTTQYRIWPVTTTSSLFCIEVAQVYFFLW